MPFPFVLPVTSSLPISSFLRCETHPSLILAATTRRNILRNLLRKHNKLGTQFQLSNLSSVQSAINDYLPYLLAIEAGLAGKSVGDEEIDVCLEKEIEVSWASRLASSVPGRELRDLRKAKGKGLDYEICFVLTTLAYSHTLLARQQIHNLYASSTPTAEQRTGFIESASKHLLQANSLHSHVSTRASDFNPPPNAKDVFPETQSALADIALAEATLLAILRHDPYPAITFQDRNKDDHEWMYKAPDVPKARAGVYVRLAIHAAEHAGKAHALLSGADEAIVRYAKNLQRTARAKACRFSGIEVEQVGKVGEGIAWLNAGKKELGLKVEEGSSKSKLGFSKLKKEWSERREDRKIEKGEEWGTDAGKLEERRVLEFLEGKWSKSNDMINTQIVPPSDPLMANLPSGRKFYDPKLFVPPLLDADILAQMRAPVDRSELEREEAQDDEDSDVENTGVEAPGAFPQGSSNQSAYY